MSGTPLLLACTRGCANVIEYLIDAGADSNARDSRDGSTALGMCEYYCHKDVRELLLSAAADSERKGARSTPIKARAQRAGVELEETPPAVRRGIEEGGPATRSKAKAALRECSVSRVRSSLVQHLLYLCKLSMLSEWPQAMYV